MTSTVPSGSRRMKRVKPGMGLGAGRSASASAAMPIMNRARSSKPRTSDGAVRDGASHLQGDLVRDGIAFGNEGVHRAAEPFGAFGDGNTTPCRLRLAGPVQQGVQFCGRWRRGVRRRRRRRWGRSYAVAHSWMNLGLMWNRHRAPRRGRRGVHAAAGLVSYRRSKFLNRSQSVTAASKASISMRAMLA